jgi:hypothetical protein
VTDCAILLMIWPGIAEDGETSTEYVTGFSKELIEGLLGGECAALVAIVLANLSVPWDDARRSATYKCTLFTSRYLNTTSLLPLTCLIDD